MTELNSVLAQLDKNQALTAQALQSVVEDLKEVKDEQKSTNNRVTKLEERRWPAHTISIIMLVIGIGTFAATYIFK